MRAWPPVCRSKRRKSQTNALSGILGLLCAEQNGRHLKKFTFITSGTSVLRTKRQTSQKLYFHKVWDLCAQNKTSEISKMHCHKLWDSCAQNKTSEISNKCTFKNYGTPAAEQHVGNIKTCTFVYDGSLVRRTTGPKSQHMHFQKLWDSVRGTKRQKS